MKLNSGLYENFLRPETRRLLLEKELKHYRSRRRKLVDPSIFFDLWRMIGVILLSPPKIISKKYPSSSLRGSFTFSIQNYIDQYLSNVVSSGRLLPLQNTFLSVLSNPIGARRPSLPLVESVKVTEVVPCVVARHCT